MELMEIAVLFSSTMTIKTLILTNLNHLIASWILLLAFTAIILFLLVLESLSQSFTSVYLYSCKCFYQLGKFTWMPSQAWKTTRKVRKNVSIKKILPKSCIVKSVYRSICSSLSLKYWKQLSVSNCFEALSDNNSFWLPCRFYISTWTHPGRSSTEHLNAA